MANGTLSTFEITGISEMAAQIGLMREQIEKAVERASIQIAGVLEAYAKGNHPWEVDTGNTNQSTIGTSVQIEPLIYEAILSAGMDYDVDLELAKNGRFAWLWPAILANQEQIQNIFSEEMSRALIL